MRKFSMLFIAGTLLLGACSKDKVQTLPLIVPNVTGTWAFNGFVGYEAALVQTDFKIYEDSIVYTDDMQYYFINNGDTTDWGHFSLGRDSAINGNGQMQRYDSIVYHSENSAKPITNDATKPDMFYFNLKGNLLSMSTLYLKDSSTTKLYHTYIRK